MRDLKKSRKEYNNRKEVLIGTLIALLMFIPMMTVATAQYEVEYQPVARYAKAVLKVTVRGPPPSGELVVSLVNPEGIEDKGSISRTELEDGIATVEVAMSGYKETPKPGTYTLVIKDVEYLPYKEKIVYTENLTFKGGGKLRIIDAKYNVVREVATGTGVLYAELTIENEGGDLPVIFEVVVKTDGKEGFLGLGSFGISPKEKKTISEPVSGIVGLKEDERYTVITELYSDDKLHDSHTSHTGAGVPGFEAVYTVIVLLAIVFFMKRKRQRPTRQQLTY